MNFAAKMLLFMSPIAVGICLLESRLEKVPNPYSQMRDLLKTDAASSEGFIIGSSHAVMGLDASAFPYPVHNGADFSQSLAIGSQIVLKILPEYRKLRHLFVDISYFTLEYQLWGTAEGWRNFYYAKYLGISGDGGWAQWLDLRNYSLLCLDGPHTVLSWLLEGFPTKVGSDLELLNLHAAPVPPGTVVQIPESLQGATRAKLHGAMMEEGRLSDNLRALTALTEAAEARGVDVTLVTLPVTPDYLRHLDPIRRERRKTQLNQFTITYPSVGYVNEEEDDRFQGSDFQDVDHLSRKGATKFTHLLIERLSKASRLNAMP
jgi:hypothetical protein